MKLKAFLLTSAVISTAALAQQSNVVVLNRKATVTETSQFEAGSVGQKNFTTKTPIETYEIVDVNGKASQEIEVFRSAKLFSVGPKRNSTGFTIMPIRPSGFLWYRGTRVRGQSETPSLSAAGEFTLGSDFEPATPDGNPDYFSTYDTAITEVGTGAAVKLSSTLTLANAPSRITYSGDSAEMFNDVGVTPFEGGIKSIVLSGTATLDKTLTINANASGGQEAVAVEITNVGSSYGTGQVATYSGLTLSQLTGYPASSSAVIVTTTAATGTGTGLTLQLTTNSSGIATASAVDSPGLGYKINDTVSIPAGQFGSSTGTTSNFTITSTAAETFTLVPLQTSGGGTGAEATVGVVNEKVESVSITKPGTGYKVGDVITINPTALGALGGTGFAGRITEVVDLTDRAVELVKQALTNTQGLTEIVP